MNKRREDLIRGQPEEDHQRDEAVSAIREARLPLLREALRKARIETAKRALEIPPECQPGFEPRDEQMDRRELRTKRSEKLTPEQLARIPQLMLEAATKGRAYDRKFTPEKIAKMNSSQERHVKASQKVKRRAYLKRRSALVKKYVSGGLG